jgi:hypothetical protein
MKIRCMVAGTGEYRLGLLVGIDDTNMVGIEEVGDTVGDLKLGLEVGWDDDGLRVGLLDPYSIDVRIIVK